MVQEKKEPELPEIPSIPEVPEVPMTEEKVEKENKGKVEVSEKEREEEQQKAEEKKETTNIQQTMHTVTDQVYRLIEIEPYKKEIKEWIKKKLKPGRTLIIGDKIGPFSEEVAEINDNVLAFDISPTFITPKAEVKNKEILKKLELKPFKKDKFLALSGPFINIIFFFALRKVKKNEQKEILKKAKEILSRNGQIIVVDEFYPRTPILFVITLIKILLNTIKSKMTNTICDYPLRKLNKLANQLELKFFQIKYDAQGRIRTYVFTKRWGALLQ